MLISECFVPMIPNFHVALYEPDIPHNTGAIARLCVATHSVLHLVGRLGFHLDDNRVKRAGLDYWEHADIRRHVDFETCRNAVQPPAEFFLSAHAKRCYTEATIPLGSLLVFGSETRGLPKSFIEDERRAFRLPILSDKVRSLNVATVAAVVLYEALRQNKIDLQQGLQS